jgi:hypothetical protein
MNQRARRMRLCALALLLPVAGCSEILDSSREAPDEAEVTVSGTSAVPLRLIVSARFIGIWNPEEGEWDVTLNLADTIQVSTLPVTRRQELNETGVFFVRLTNPDLEETATVHMRVRIDGREVYSQAATMRDASLEYVYFTR